jgi:predicted RNA-binding Zn-ribbon protein involved in translation (DUF1610 family)
MKNNNCLSTRTEKCCPQCGEEFILAEPTDVLATRPVQVDLVCPDCHFPGRALLTADQSFRSVFPSPNATGNAEPNFGEGDWLTQAAFDPLPRFQRTSKKPRERMSSLDRLLN